VVLVFLLLLILHRIHLCKLDYDFSAVSYVHHKSSSMHRYILLSMLLMLMLQVLLVLMNQVLSKLLQLHLKLRISYFYLISLIYAHIDYSDKKDPDDGLPDENVISLVELPVYSINRPRPDSLFVLKLLSEVKGAKLKKSKLIEQIEEEGLIDKDLSIAAKHSKLKGLLNPISIAGGIDNPLVEVEYRGRQSNVILTSQGESTLKIFG
jgi:hypothetical protein